MGNQLVGAAPGQIISVENYISDIADLEFDGNLGSTRFLKVCRARHQSSGLVVVKVFPIQDAGLDLKKYQEKLSDIKKVLEGSVNCLPFYRNELKDRAGYINRWEKKVSREWKNFVKSINSKSIVFTKFFVKIKNRSFEESQSISRKFETKSHRFPWNWESSSHLWTFLFCRQYIKDSLYDRISTRPFLTPIGKTKVLWIVDIQYL